jgi:NAD+ synthase (glutamine-hydrolysing)
MQYGFIKVAAGTPQIVVADSKANTVTICNMMDEMYEKGARIMVFPELCITGYTCGDLFLQELLLEEAKEGLLKIIHHTAYKDGIVFVGLPFEKQGKLYNTVAAISRGKLLGMVPKTYIPNYGEFYEARHFVKGNQKPVMIQVGNDNVPFGTDLLFECEEWKGLCIGAEICEDVWAPNPPSISHALAGGTIIVNASASDELTGKRTYRNELIRGQSSRLVCGYIYANAGEGESTTDLVFSGHNMIVENGVVLEESGLQTAGIIYGDIDIRRLVSERRRLTTFLENEEREHLRVPFHLKIEETKLDRTFDKMPFVPNALAKRKERCEEILNIQALGLKKRLEHTRCQSAVVGISGGLDSTLALLVTVRAFDLLRMDRSQICAVTMPCFGTTDRTYTNACRLIEALGATFREVDIKESVLMHFKDIGHDVNCHDVTYENAQARERTQVLMDIANQTNGMVIGTGDMSELALGWATYNGDHMSMYGVNTSIPKTLVRYLVEYCADTFQAEGDETLSKTLYDVLATPVSPELLPPKDGVIVQVTEDLVGPYELHDFFLYYVLRFGYEPEKLYHIAALTFEGVYTKEIILKWLKTFYRRFFSQQFKRSCLPDGPKVGTVAISPRGDLRMPSDASARLWMEKLEQLEA